MASSFSLLLPIISFVVAFSLLSPAMSEIKTLSITSDTRPIILFEKFGFTPRGFVSISLSSVFFASSLASPDPSLFGFFLLSNDNLIQAMFAGPNADPNPNLCVLSSPYVRVILTFNELKQNAYNNTFPISLPDEHSLFFANCAPESKVSMDVRTEMYNTNGDGSRDYLSVGQAPVPTAYFLFFLAYCVFFAFWVYFCLVRDRSSVHRIHALMGGLLLTKALNLMFAAEDQHYVRTTGTPHGWDVLFYLFQLLKGVLLFTVIVLIGTGWSFLKPFLQEREKKVLMVVIPLQVVANVASVVIGETGPFIRDWVTWNQVFLLVDIVCCCAILYPIVWSIRTLKETSKTDGKAARNLAKLTLFRQFYIVVIGYLYFTRIVVYALKTITAYRYRWTSTVAEETVSLAFYVFMFHMFRPEERNQYFVLDEEEEEAAQAVLREEEFEL